MDKNLEIWEKVYANYKAGDINEPDNVELAESISGYLTRKQKLLEVGSGSGSLSAYLAKKGHHVSLLDQAENALSVSRLLFDGNGLKGEFVKGDLFRMPFNDNSFDCVWNSGVLEHFKDEDIVLGLEEMKRVSRDLVITLIPYANSLFYILGKDKLVDEGKWEYEKEFPKYSMLPFFKEAGLNIVDEKIIGIFSGLKWLTYSGLLTDESLIQNIKIFGLKDSERAAFLKRHVGYLLITVGTKNKVTKKLQNFDVNCTSFLELIEEKDMVNKKLKKQILSLKNAIKESEDEILLIKNSNTYKLGILVGTVIKQPWQIPRITKRFFVTVLKRILPPSTRVIVKKFVSRYLYLFNPTLLITKKKNQKILREILKKEKYKGIIIYPPTIDWEMPLFQRPQQLALAFANEDYLFFYCTANLNKDNVHGFKKVQDNLYVTNQVDVLREIKDSILFISWPINRYFVERFPGSKLIYDYIDELDVFDAAGFTEKEMIESHKFLVSNADLVVCTADKLLEDVQILNPKKAILSPNAVDIDHFKNISNESIPEDLKKIINFKKPIIGYYGAIAEWFDYKLLEEIAKKRSEYEFLMIGPLDYDKTLKQNKHLFKIKNIHFVGPKKYTELPTYLSKFSVAIIPFVINGITESTSPVKLFEYMAGGKPIVTTDMRECRKYKSVFIAKNADEFVELLDQAIKKDDDKAYKKILDYEASDNTWASRANQIIENIISVSRH